MIGVIWNCRGIAKNGLSSFIKELIWEHKAGFVSLQETMKNDIPDKLLRKIDPDKNFIWHWTPANGRSGGMLSGIKQEYFDIEIFESNKYCIVADVLDKRSLKKMTPVNVYGQAQEVAKESFLIDLSDVIHGAKYPMLMGGDFNILRFSDEKNKNFNESKYTDMFNMIINLHSLRELYMAGGKYTWSNNRDFPTLEKLDRVLMSQDWEHEYPLCNLHIIPRYISDHNPLRFISEIDHKKGNKHFFL